MLERKNKMIIFRANNLILLMIVIVLIIFLMVQKNFIMGAEENEYAGMEACANCHEDIVKTFRGTMHYREGFRQRSDKSCEECHGAASAHVEAGGDKSKILSVASLTSEQKEGMCLKCHETGDKMFWMGSMHDKRGLACQDCHSVHSFKNEKSQLKTVNEAKLCFTCHKQKEALFYRVSHHPVREGKVNCSDCHNPHGSPNAKLIKADSVTEQCYPCHAEKRGPFLWEHAPVREDCTNCHEVHGSNHLKLLNAKQPFLCQRCHSGARHPGTLYDAKALKSNRLFNRSCTNCHSTIHGSSHPSGHTFLR